MRLYTSLFFFRFSSSCIQKIAVCQKLLSLDEDLECESMVKLRHFVPRRSFLPRLNSAGIELFHEAFVAELFHKAIVDKLGEKSLDGPAGDT